jgi:hypothetical protein
MGSSFDCWCNDCDHKFQVVQGGGFSFVHLCCDGCGNTKSLPRYAPRTCPKPVVSPIKKLSQAIGNLTAGGPGSSNQVPDLTEDQLRAYFERYDQQPWVRQGAGCIDDEGKGALIPEGARCGSDACLVFQRKARCGAARQFCYASALWIVPERLGKSSAERAR